MNRCFGAENTLLADYHDHEWGIPVHDDAHLFELLTLEGAQAGLNWEAVLSRRQGYRKHFPSAEVVARFSDEDLEQILYRPEIIRHRLKVFSVRKNAQIFLNIQEGFGSFDHYLWRFVDGRQKVNHWKTRGDVPAVSAESHSLSKDLKKQGMSFVGPTIMYAFMQAAGMVDDHYEGCWKRTGS